MTTAGAIFSDDRTKRIVLWRRWGSGTKFAVCIGLNPSTANETSNDRTIGFLLKLLAANGYDGFKMCNLFTDITSKPYELPLAKSEQDVQHIAELAAGCDVFFCWGSFKEAQDRAEEVIKMFPDAWCLGRNFDKRKTPKHPAWYIRNGVSVQLVPIHKFNGGE